MSKAYSWIGAVIGSIIGIWMALILEGLIGNEWMGVLNLGIFSLIIFAIAGMKTHYAILVAIFVACVSSSLFLKSLIGIIFAAILFSIYVGYSWGNSENPPKGRWNVIIVNVLTFGMPGAALSPFAVGAVLGILYVIKEIIGTPITTIPFFIIPIFAISGYIVGEPLYAWVENKWLERQRLAEEQRRKKEARLEAERREQERREGERRRAEEERRRREEEEKRRLEGMKQEIIDKIDEVTKK